MRMEKVVGMLMATVLAGFVSAPASAVTMTVTNIASTITNTGNCVLVSTCPENYVVNSQAGGTVAVTVPPQQSFGFTDSFNQGAGSLNVNTGSNLGPSAYYGNAQTKASAPWNFEDNILFSTNGASVMANAIANLTNVSDLQIRIISLNNPATSTLFDVTLAANAKTLLGPSPGVTVVPGDGWQNFTFGGVDFTATMPAAVAPGSYILQVRGEAAAGSTYSGNITFTPVPVPAAAWLLVSGLSLLVRRRSAAAVPAAIPA